jgi:hypothetical protein
VSCYQTYYALFADGYTAPSKPEEEGLYQNGFHSEGNCIIKRSNSNHYIICGERWADNQGTLDADVYLLEIGEDGTLYEETTIGGLQDDLGYCILEIDDGYIIVGSTRSFGAGGNDVYVVRTNYGFSVQDYRCFGGPKDDVAYSIDHMPNGGYIICGSTQSYGAGDDNVYVLYLDADLNMIEWRTYGLSSTYDCGYSIQAAHNGYILAGDCIHDRIPGNNDDIYAVRYYEDPPPKVRVSDDGSTSHSAFTCEFVHPNPTKGAVHIRFVSPDVRAVTINLLDATGRVVESLLAGKAQIGLNEIHFIPETFAAGVYFLRIEAGDYRLLEKLVLIE